MRPVSASEYHRVGDTSVVELPLGIDCMNKQLLSERDICTKFITPTLMLAGWDPITQVREEVSFTKGRIIVRGKLVTRGRAKRADYVLSYKPNIPLALIEAKDNTHSVGDGIQQALEYAATLDIPFVFPRTAMASSFTTAPARAPLRNRTSGSTPSRPLLIYGRAIALGR